MEQTKRKKGERYYHGFKEGDQVWLEGTNLQLSHLSTKLAPKQYGPFKVLREISPVIYHLELPPHWTLCYAQALGVVEVGSLSVKDIA